LKKRKQHSTQAQSHKTPTTKPMIGEPKSLSDR